MDKLVKDSGRYKYDHVKRWSKGFDAFELDKIFVPINIGNSHWVLGVIFIQKKEVHYYDSMHGNGSNYRNAMMRWVVDEAKAKKGITINKAEWKSIAVGTAPQQFNGTDCGVFTIMAADFLSDDLPVNEETYGQDYMPYFRHMFRGQLDYPMIVV
jgi:Ulp1 family protease